MASRGISFVWGGHRAGKNCGSQIWEVGAKQRISTGVLDGLKDFSSPLCANFVTAMDWA